jgi:isocitrate lyase
LQDQEFDSERDSGYEAVKHQRFVGTGYFDQVTQVIAGGASSVTALEGSTEQEQFTVPIDLGAGAELKTAEPAA